MIDNQTTQKPSLWCMEWPLWWPCCGCLLCGSLLCGSLFGGFPVGCRVRTRIFVIAITRSSLLYSPTRRRHPARPARRERRNGGVTSTRLIFSHQIAAGTSYRDLRNGGFTVASRREERWRCLVSERRDGAAESGVILFLPVLPVQSHVRLQIISSLSRELDPAVR